MNKFNLAKMPPPRILNALHLGSFGRFPLILLLFLLFHSISYTQNVSSQELPICGMNVLVDDEGTEGEGCSQNFTNFLSNHLDDMIPENVSRTLKIKINVVFMQRENGSDCYSLSNPDHVTYWNNIFDEINQRFLNVEEESCGCSTAPEHYNNIHLEFVPNYVEVQDEYGWNHENDLTGGGNSYNSTFLNYCHNLASLEPEYEAGIDMIITNTGTRYDAFDLLGVPLWEIPIQPKYIIGGSSVWYSSVAKSNPSELNHQAIMHAPEMYLLHRNAEEYLSLSYLNGAQFDWVVGSIMHEISHMLFFSVGHKSCQKNVMNPSSSIRTSYSGCQVRDMYRALMTSYVRKYVICEDVLEHDITVDEDEEWNNNMRLYSNVVVKPGNTLNISCELYMQPHAKITVERGARLILGENAIIANGGVCNDANPEKRWAGIQVEGNNAIQHNDDYALEAYSLVAGDHGIVLLLNGSTVRDARTGVACLSPTQSGSDYWGGYINADGVSFLNNGRSFEFMLSNFNNKSVINNSLFVGDPLDEGDVAITNWHSNNVTIKNSEFNDFGQAIYSIDAGMNVVKNTFNRNKDAIAMDNMLFLSHGYFVINNAFNRNHVSVKASGASSLVVRHNDFFENVFGVSLMGAGQATIKNNLFDINATAVDLQSSGNNSSPIKCNIFSGNGAGVNASGSCVGMNYVQNQNGEDVHNYADMFIEANASNTTMGAVSDFGSSSFPPLNSWSQTNDGLNIVTKPNETIVFDYYAPPISIFVPQCYIGDSDCQGVINNFSWVQADEGSNYCGNIGTYEVGGGTPDDKFPDLRIRESEPELVNKNNTEVIASIQNAFQNGDYDLVLRGEAGRKLLNISQQFIAQDDYEGLDAYLSQFGEGVLPLRYSIDVQRKDYTAASTKLETLASTGGNDDYVLPQQLYLGWIESKTNFADDQNFHDKLVELEQKDTPNSAYARSMLGILYGEKFEPKLPVIDGKEVEKPETTKAPNGNLVIPNPFDMEVKIQTEDYESGEITIYNTLGKLFYSTKVNSEREITIKTASWKPGIYFLFLKDARGTTHSEKIVKQ